MKYNKMADKHMYYYVSDRELASAIWSNRSAAFSKLKKYDEAWSDAQSCIRVYPDWYKVRIVFVNCLLLLLLHIILFVNYVI